MRIFSALFGVVLLGASMNSEKVIADTAPTQGTPTLTLTDVYTGNTFTNHGDLGGGPEAQTSISKQGDKVFLFLLNQANPTSLPARSPFMPPFQEAVLLSNAAGKLTPLATQFFDNTYYHGTAAGAAPNFKRFVLIEDDNALFPSFPTTRIRVFNSELDAVLNTLILPNTQVAAPQAVFTEDGKLFAISVKVNPDISNPSSPTTTFIQVYRTKNLKLVTQFQISPTQKSTSAIFGTSNLAYFRIRKPKGEIKEYFVYDGGFLNPFATAGSGQTGAIDVTLNIAKIDRDGDDDEHSKKHHKHHHKHHKHHHDDDDDDVKLTLVSTTLLPNVVNDIATLRLPNNKLQPFGVIGVACERSDLEGETITFQIAPEISLLPFDGDEMRVYHFNGKKGKEATLFASKNTKLDNFGLAFDPQDLGTTVAGTITVLPQNTSANPGNANFFHFYFDLSSVFHLYQIDGPQPDAVAPLGIVELDKVYSVGSQSRSMQFSQNGQWLVVAAGAGGPQVNDPMGNQFFAWLGTNVNLALFQVNPPTP